jgi:CRISPR/Cas system-associated protein endoribonuclease Cas2
VQIIVITDKQYENIKTYAGRENEPQEKPQQLTLF